MKRLIAIFIFFGFVVPLTYGQTITLDDGSAYDGQMEDGVPQGFGTKSFPDGKQYAGEFKNGKFHGRGTITFPSGKKYDGEWNEGKMTKGVYEFPDGSKFDGDFKNDAGWNGKLTSMNGDVIRVWEDGHDRVLKRFEAATGFIVNENYLLTAFHLIEDCLEIRIGQLNGGTKVREEASDAKHDLGLLKSEIAFEHIAKFRGNDDLRKGDTVVIYGYPLYTKLADGGKPSTGQINALSGWENEPTEFQYDAPTHQGNSGGPVLDLVGNVVGIVSSQQEEYRNISFAVKSDVVEKFLSANGVDFEKVESKGEMKTADIVEKAEKFTVLLECWK